MADALADDALLNVFRFITCTRTLNRAACAWSYSPSSSPGLPPIPEERTPPGALLW